LTEQKKQKKHSSRDVEERAFFLGPFHAPCSRRLNLRIRLATPTQIEVWPVFDASQHSAPSELDHSTLPTVPISAPTLGSCNSLDCIARYRCRAQAANGSADRRQQPSSSATRLVA
jgi:hypothetical protein